MIKVDNMSKSYGDVEAVNSISFDLRDGEIVGFLGANGAGKSTTLKVMTGYLSATAGSVYVNPDEFFSIKRKGSKNVTAIGHIKT